MSLEFSSSISAADIPELIEAIRYAHRRGVLLVAAAGNEGRSTIPYPARSRDVVAVGATTEHGCLANYSNDGPGITLVAPGGGPDASLPATPTAIPKRPPAGHLPGDHRRDATDVHIPTYYEGTSMAAPHVVRHGRAHNRQRRPRTPSHPRPADGQTEGNRAQLGGGGDEGLYGAGLLNAGAATAPGGPGSAGRVAASLKSVSNVEQHTPAPARCDVAVVGGGIVGLAVARELLKRNPRTALCVLERETQVGTHQTGHNSGVIHAGVYYTPGSLKARLCVEGARELYEYCAERGIPVERGGKVIVATDPPSSPAWRSSSAGSRQRGPRPARIDAEGITGARAARTGDRRPTFPRIPASSTSQWSRARMRTTSLTRAAPL